MFKSPISLDWTAWIYLSCFVGSFVPQIIKNFKIRSTKGLNDCYLLCYLAGYIALVYYVFAANLLFAYKVIVPFGLFAILILITQRVYFDDILHKKWFFMVVASLIVAAVCMFPFYFRFTKTLGIFTGWAAVGFLSINQAFQVNKIYRSKSVEGFSFTFITMIAIGVIFELAVAFLRGLPLPTKFLAFRGLVFYVIFCTQFLLYRQR